MNWFQFLPRHSQKGQLGPTIVRVCAYYGLVLDAYLESNRPTVVYYFKPSKWSNFVQNSLRKNAQIPSISEEADNS